MQISTSLQLEFILRIILAGICGGIIGYERKHRGKGAGIRTHMIVAMAASLMMIVSKYGFTDLVGFPGAKEADPSRIASQVISGVSFLGAGMIYLNRHAIKGLTTAAGIWAIAGVGLSIGAGMYLIGVASTAIIVLSQIILHKDLKIMQVPNEYFITVVIKDNEQAIEYVKSAFEKNEITIDSMNLSKKENELIKLELGVSLPPSFKISDLLDYAKNNGYVESITI